MTEYDVQVARDRTEYITVIVKANDKAEAERKALKHIDSGVILKWKTGGDTDSPFVVEVEESK